MFARSPSRSFGHSRISYRCFARSSSSFWFDPRSRSHLKTEQFRDAPDVIGQPCCHGWCAKIPEMLSVTQLMMRPTEIVGTSDQIHSRLKGLQTLGGMPTFTSQSSQTFPHGLGKDTARLVPFGSYVSASSPPNPACHFHCTRLSIIVDPLHFSFQTSPRSAECVLLGVP